MIKIKIGYILTKYSFFKKNGAQSSRCFSLIIKSDEFSPIIFDTGSPTQVDFFIQKLKEDFRLILDDIRWVFNIHSIYPDHIWKQL